MFRGSRGLAKDSSDQLFGLIQRADIGIRWWREARRTPRPPSAAGREDFSQDQLGKGPHAKLERASSIESSKAEVASLMRCGGQERRAKETLGRAKQDQRMVVSI